VLWEREGFSWSDAWRVPNAGVSGLRAQAGFLAHEFHRRPSEHLWVCGVTGTNGKTTCSQWLAALLASAGARAAVLGTLGGGFPGALEPVENTTPDALEVHRLLARFRSAGARAVAMEVSSHGLAQGRVNGVAFACALFTNLTHDHLDYHGSMRAYGEAKARLFETPGLGAAVLNLDDPFGAELAGRAAERGARVLGFGFAARGGSDEFLLGTELGGGALRIAFGGAEATVTIPHPGRHSASNALGVLGCLLAHGVPFGEGVRLLEALPPVPGRLQRLGGEGVPLVVVDYAHTPDALEQVLRALRPLATARGGRLVVVFGAGGGRDSAKRPRMGAVAARLADRVLLTSDNPRGEDPAAIIEQIRAGAGAACAVEPDRAAAIAAAIADADTADVVLLAGKGHETYQEIAGRRLAFSDATAAAEALARRRGSGA